MRKPDYIRKEDFKMKIIIPAYEPDDNLLKLIQDIKDNSNYEIIIVDDGSSIKCNDIFDRARKHDCIVLTHTSNQGKGVALKTAFSYVLNNSDEDGVICADCDGQHTWQDIIKIAEAIPFHKTSIILGCREFVGKVPFKNLIGNKITRFIFALVSGCKITDTQTGLRGFSAQMLSWLLQLKGDHYEYEMNQLLEAKSAGYQLFSIPIETIYENNNESSHFRPVRDSIRIYIPILKFSLSSMSCGIIDFGLVFLLNWLSNNLFLSVVIARVFSSLINYILNKNIVFNSKDQHHRLVFVKYYVLVACILLLNYLLISFFINVLSLSLFISKILTECILFTFSYFIQHRFIFSSHKYKA